MESSEFICPQCSAVLRLTEESGFTQCAFCRTSVYLDPGFAVRHEMLAPVLTREEVAPRLVDWLSRHEAAGRPHVLSARLVSFPFFVFPAAQDPVPAAPLLALPVEPFRLPAGDAKAFDPAMAADVVPATVLIGAVLPPGEVAPAGTRLVHLPLWEVSFQIFSNEHRALVDAVSGQVLPYSYPASSERFLDLGYAAVLVALFLVVTRGFRWILTTTPLFSPVMWGAGFDGSWLWPALGVPRHAALEIALAGPVAWGLVRLASWASLKLRGAG